MDNLLSLRAVESSTFSRLFRKPCYGSYCFAGIPGTVLSSFGIDHNLPYSLPTDALPSSQRQPRTVVLLFIDAFGWHALERYCSSRPLPAVQALRERSVSSKITSQFPSTTAAHVTTIHSGLPLAMHGIYEWYFYSALHDAILTPLPFVSPHDPPGTTLQERGITPESFLPASQFYPALLSRGITPHVFQSRNFIHSPYNRRVLDGCTLHPTRSYSHAFKEAAAHLLSSKSSEYLFLYVDEFDHDCHIFGPNSDEADACAAGIFAALDEYLLQPLSARSGEKGDVLFCVTADHGQVSIDYRTTLYLDESVQDLIPTLRKNKNGELLCPNGSPRDFFVHVSDDQVEYAERLLKDSIGARGEIHRIAEMRRDGIFSDGSVDDAILMRNLSQLVILPFENESVEWAGPGGRFKKSFLGHHGGLLPQEMDSIFLSLLL